MEKSKFICKILVKFIDFCNFASILKDIHNKDYSVVKNIQSGMWAFGRTCRFFIQPCRRSSLSFSPSVNWHCTSTCLSRCAPFSKVCCGNVALYLREYGDESIGTMHPEESRREQRLHIHWA